MYARNVALRLKPNTLSDFTKTFDTKVLPILRKQRDSRTKSRLRSPVGPT